MYVLNRTDWAFLGFADLLCSITSYTISSPTEYPASRGLEGCSSTTQIRPLQRRLQKTLCHGQVTSNWRVRIKTRP